MDTAQQGRPPVVDVHTHFMPPDLPDFATLTGDQRWPLLRVVEGEDTAAIMRGDTLFRRVTAPCWDPEARLAEMDAADVDVQVLSPLPLNLTYWADADRAAEFARHINDWLAQAVPKGGGRFRGLGTVPLQDPGAAITELRRATVDLGLDGIEIGTVVDGLELDAAELRPFFRAADELDVPLFVHPIDGECATRVHSPTLSFGVGTLTDTALAASALVFGGVLREFPNLRVCLAHGGGSFPWVFPRQARAPGWPEDGPSPADLARRFFVDAMVIDPEHLRILKARFGAEHIVVGSDYPIAPAKPGPHAILERAVAGGVCTPDEAAAMQGPNAWEFLARRTPAE